MPTDTEIQHAGRFARRVIDGLSRRWRGLVVGIASATGRYERWRRVDWSRVDRLVFVCSGNICRSPYAAQLARDRGFLAESFGITALSGSPADPTAIAVAARFGVDLRAHRSLSQEELFISRNDLLVAMDTDHLEAVQRVMRAKGAQVTLLGLWDGTHPAIIADPFGRAVEDFEICFNRIVHCMNQLLEAAGRAS